MTQWAIVALLLGSGVRRFAGNLADLLRQCEPRMPDAERAESAKLRKALEGFLR